MHKTAGNPEIFCGSCEVDLDDESIVAIHMAAGHKIEIRDYVNFVASKRVAMSDSGLTEVGELSGSLYDFQKAIDEWALRKGRAALFCDCGLGKTLLQLVWADAIPERTLILAPLAVALQTVREGKKFGIDVVYEREAKSKKKIVVTNYDMLDHFDPTKFGGIVLDESSSLKNSSGQFRNQVIGSFGRTKFRLPCTATPAPNDFMELGNHSEFLETLRNNSDIIIDQELMQGWFANALMRGFDECHWKTPEYKRSIRRALYPWWNWKRYFEREG